MHARLDDLWGQWTASGLPSAALAPILAALVLLWLASGVFVTARARRRWRPAGWWGLAAVVPSLVIAGAGLLAPANFHWWVIGACASGVAIAALLRSVLDRAVGQCSHGHDLGPSWVYCPRCPAPTALPSPAAAVAAGRIAPPVVVPPRVATAGVGFDGLAVGGGHFPAARGYPGPPQGGLVDRAATPGPTGEVMLWLIPESRPSLGERIVRAPGALVGRNPAADVALDDQGVSWEHARIIERDGSPAVVDLGSSNGTFVNGERVETSLLISGDRLRLGDTEFRVVRP